MIEGQIPGGLGLTGLIIILVGLFILWVVVSIPVYVASKIVAGKRASFGGAMGATLLGPIVYFVVLIGVEFFLGALIGEIAPVLALILAFLAWLGVYKSMFHTGWIGAFGIALLAVVVFFILALIIGFLIGISAPGIPFPAPTFTPI